MAEDNRLLGNVADDHTISVFQPMIRGKTDQFVLKFHEAQVVLAGGAPMPIKMLFSANEARSWSAAGT